jgi:ABC-type Fe3+-hydroxamate transport system substrate-binding protein
MRVVSLCPSLTELVFALGRGEALVGRTKFCIHPAEEVGKVPRVGGTKNPKVERILALGPDLVLANVEENRREDIAALEQAGLACHVSFPRTVEATAEMVRSIGAALGAAAEAEALAGAIEAALARVRAAASGRRVRYAYLIWNEPLMTISEDTYIAAVLAAAGGENVYGDRAARYPTSDAAELARLDPDVVWLSSEPFPFAERHGDALAAASGLPRARFRLVDGEHLSWHGARTPLGLDYAARVVAEAITR